MRSTNTPLARSLRQKLTSTEKTLWYKLRDRRFRGWKFRRQQPFGPYVLDFYCADAKLNIEIDGGQHDLPEHRRRDEKRMAYLEKEGVRTLRFWNSQVRTNIEGVMARIGRELEAEAPPSP